jgi:hypothetical protein
MPPPLDAQVESELAESVNEWITIDGAVYEKNGKAAIWISDEIVIVAVDRADWPNRPSHRSHIMVTGYLTRNGGQYEIDRTTFDWVDQ